MPADSSSDSSSPCSIYVSAACCMGTDNISCLPPGMPPRETTSIGIAHHERPAVSTSETLNVAMALRFLSHANSPNSNVETTIYTPNFFVSAISAQTTTNPTAKRSEDRTEPRVRANSATHKTKSTNTHEKNESFDRLHTASGIKGNNPDHSARAKARPRGTRHRNTAVTSTDESASEAAQACSRISAKIPRRESWNSVSHA